MKRHRDLTPIAFIGMIRAIYPDRYRDFSGGCFKFHLLLKMVFPGAEGFYNGSHVITRIGRCYYDVGGRFCRSHHVGYLPFSEYGIDHIKKAFSFTGYEPQ